MQSPLFHPPRPSISTHTRVERRVAPAGDTSEMPRKSTFCDAKPVINASEVRYVKIVPDCESLWQDIPCFSTFSEKTVL